MQNASGLSNLIKSENSFSNAYKKGICGRFGEIFLYCGFKYFWRCCKNTPLKIGNFYDIF